MRVSAGSTPPPPVGKGPEQSCVLACPTVAAADQAQSLHHSPVQPAAPPQKPPLTVVIFVDRILSKTPGGAAAEGHESAAWEHVRRKQVHSSPGCGRHGCAAAHAWLTRRQQQPNYPCKVHTVAPAAVRFPLPHINLQITCFAHPRAASICALETCSSLSRRAAMACTAQHARSELGSQYTTCRAVTRTEAVARHAKGQPPAGRASRQQAHLERRLLHAILLARALLRHKCSKSFATTTCCPKPAHLERCLLHAVLLARAFLRHQLLGPTQHVQSAALSKPQLVAHTARGGGQG